ncbi:MAG: zinc ABC transporter substrate-binding protein [Dehalococcoidia bacterium]|nr:zinc ABC transporter substrate-binding protein [Dehalococcoidia bacterium]MSQ34820.1 zinc ABC transporter substrate-binding protein [Dehalococcoidia bacterium]
MIRILPTIAMVLIMVVNAACGDDGSAAISSRNSGEPLHVVTTVSPVTNIAENVGGTKVKITGVVPEGANAHTFEPAPSLAKTLAQADLLVINGLFLEEPTLRLALASMRPGTPVLSLGDRTVSRDEWQFDFSFPEEDGHPNPHLWPDPIHSLRYAELIKDELSRLDPSNSSYFSGNYDKFKQRIDQLDAAIKLAVASVPEKNRLLLTYHDSWAYFAKRYGLTVVGAVQPADFTEPSARDVATLILQVRELGVPAIFGSEVFPSAIMEQIARETGALFVDKLRDDDLPGVPGGPLHSYLGLMITNLRYMVPALGGDISAMSGVDAGPVFEGDSDVEYPQ